MATAKIDFTWGAFSFSGEGDEVWVEKQLDKILEKAPELHKLVPAPAQPPAPPGSGGHPAPLGNITLANYIKSSKAGDSDIGRFLTTAVWLQLKGATRVGTRDVTQALRASNQKRLGNASECLNQNVGKGFCEKDGKAFFVTEQGIASVTSGGQ